MKAHHLTRNQLWEEIYIRLLHLADSHSRAILSTSPSCQQQRQSQILYPPNPSIVMHSTPSLLALAAAALLSSTTSAAPLQPSGNSTSSSSLPANSVNCSNISAGLAPACWFQLNMTAYFNDWVANSPYANETAYAESSNSSGTSDTSGNPFEDVTTGTFNGSNFRARAVAAAAADPASGQCQGSKSFSTCYLSLQSGYKPGKTDCSKINYGGANGTCSPPRAVDFANRPQAFYAVWNFYCKFPSPMIP